MTTLFFPPFAEGVWLRDGAHDTLAERYGRGGGGGLSFTMIGEPSDCHTVIMLALGASPDEDDGVPTWWWADGLVEAWGPDRVRLALPRTGNVPEPDPRGAQWCPALAATRSRFSPPTWPEPAVRS